MRSRVLEPINDAPVPSIITDAGVIPKNMSFSEALMSGIKETHNKTPLANTGEIPKNTRFSEAHTF